MEMFYKIIGCCIADPRPWLGGVVASLTPLDISVIVGLVILCIAGCVWWRVKR